MKLERTAKAKEELKPGVRTLGQRERTLLLLVDGHRTLTDLAALLQCDVQELVRQLTQDGYLLEANPKPTQPSVAADAFNGKRSLATTRMFLFDICERMFVKRAPEQAEHFREALRDARDKESMLAVGHLLIAEIEQLAGKERADSIAERIAMLLPPETVAEAHP
jgi:hypothetical protein